MSEFTKVPVTAQSIEARARALAHPLDWTAFLPEHLQAHVRQAMRRQKTVDPSVHELAARIAEDLPPALRGERAHWVQQLAEGLQQALENWAEDVDDAAAARDVEVK